MLYCIYFNIYADKVYLHYFCYRFFFKQEIFEDALNNNLKLD